MQPADRKLLIMKSEQFPSVPRVSFFPEKLDRNDVKKAGIPEGLIQMFLRKVTECEIVHLINSTLSAIKNKTFSQITDSETLIVAGFTAQSLVLNINLGLLIWKNWRNNCHLLLFSHHYRTSINILVHLKEQLQAHYN